MVALEQALAQTIDLELLELVKLRASQINGCAFCIYMHTTDLRKRGVDEMKLYVLNAWRDSYLYSDREGATFGWTEAQRPRLLRHAYRMLGSLSEAEDVVQDAWPRWAAARDEVGAPGVYLTRIVMRWAGDVEAVRRTLS